MISDTKALTTIQPTTALTAVVDKARQFAANSKARNTIRAYQADWQHFRGWCAEYGLDALPATPSTVASYIADLASNAKVATITRRLAAISKAHQAAGCESPCSMKHIAVKEVLAGIKRTKTTAQNGKAALLTDALRSLMRAMPDSLLGKRDAALLVLGFAGGFRRSELVALTMVDVERCEDGVKVTLRRSKTDQEGQGRVVGIPHGSNPQLSPVRALQHWLDAAGVTEGPVFRSVDRHGNVGSSALTDQMVGRVLKRYCADANLDATQFGAHSLRAGMATQAAINGASERSIMRQTGHKSAAMVRRYIRDSDLFRDNAASRVGL
jgi:site-specific recombinase XerD